MDREEAETRMLTKRAPLEKPALDLVLNPSRKHAHRAGGFSRTKNLRPGGEMQVGDEQRDARGYVCQEADQHLRNAKKNTRGSRDNGTKRSEGINGNKTRLSRAAWMKWPNCASTPPSRLRYSVLARVKGTLRRSPLLAIVLASNEGNRRPYCEGFE